MCFGSVCSAYPLRLYSRADRCLSAETLEDTQSGQYDPSTIYPLIYSLRAPITLAFMRKPFVGKVREMESIQLTMMEGE
jgi:hypothetical protein